MSAIHSNCPRLVLRHLFVVVIRSGGLDLADGLLDVLLDLFPDATELLVVGLESLHGLADGLLVHLAGVVTDLLGDIDELLVLGAGLVGALGPDGLEPLSEVGESSLALATEVVDEVLDLIGNFVDGALLEVRDLGLKLGIHDGSLLAGLLVEFFLFVVSLGLCATEVLHDAVEDLAGLAVVRAEQFSDLVSGAGVQLLESVGGLGGLGQKFAGLAVVVVNALLDLLDGLYRK